VTSEGESIVLSVDGCSCTLSRSDAAQLQESIGEALTERREFFRTACEHREDGAYVVARRGADSAGNEKVFDEFRECRRLFERLPEEFTADDIGTTGITGSRRHMLVRHFAEHPEFDCTISRRNPLTAEKTEGEAETDSSDTVAEAPAD
jgi:hypothetical protein